MMDSKVLYILTLCHILHTGLCIFYHESSRISATPEDPVLNSDFGFSLGYKDDAVSTLVVGAPRYDLNGRVYTCPVQEILNEESIACAQADIDIDSMVNYTRDISPQQNFYFGSSIAATADYFLTCAPLMTMALATSSGKKNDAYGTCIVYDDNAHRYRGTLERYQSGKNIRKLNLIQGGIGWNTLIDRKNNLTLIVKTSLNGDIVYVPLSDPSAESKSLLHDMPMGKSKLWLERQSTINTNLGYGIAAGNFFSRETVYAFSMTTPSMSGIIAFLKFVPKFKILTILKRNKDSLLIKNTKFGSMFGYAMAAADINLDGYSELLVGAPAYYDNEKFEYGAVHIYIGGDMDLINDKSKLRTIKGAEREARFGSCVTTHDIDGDSIPEIFISAPYEDSGIGAVYILSGFEVNKVLLSYAKFKEIQVSDLKFSQRIQAAEHRHFGFSFQIIRDIDNNGCNELAVGSPGSGAVLFYRCIPAINVTVTTNLIGAEFVREQDNNFKVAVCTEIQYSSISAVSANLILSNSIEGIDASIPKSKFVIPLSDMESFYCNNVTVLLNNSDPGDYKFTAKVNLNFSEIQDSKEFNSSWVTLSPYSRTERSMEIARYCKDEDCKSNLTMNVSWSGNNKDYLLGSNETETVMISVRNEGHNAYDACVMIRISGATVVEFGCPDDNGTYVCTLKKPLRRRTEEPLYVTLNMSQPTNSDRNLKVVVRLLEFCHNSQYTEELLDVNYILDTTQIYVQGSSKDRTITDMQIMDTDTQTINGGHEYLIINNGSILWINVMVVILMEKKEFIQSYSGTTTGADDCMEEDKDDFVSFTCNVNLMPNSTRKITAAMDIYKDKIIDNLVERTLNTTSSVTVYLKPTDAEKSERITTLFTYQQVLSFDNNKNLIILIATIVSLLILAIIIFALYKFKFFERKQKRKLKSLRANVRRGSERRENVRRNALTNENDATNVSDCAEGIELEVLDDSPFEESPMPTNSSDGERLCN